MNPTIVDSDRAAHDEGADGAQLGSARGSSGDAVARPSAAGTEGSLDTSRSAGMRTAAGVLGALAVAAGAFGAHGLRGHVPPERLDTWQTAASYHLAHAVVLLVLATLPAARPTSFGLFSAGILLFSGSLYLLVLLDLPVLGAITPLGGVAFIAGWLSLVRR